MNQLGEGGRVGFAASFFHDLADEEIDRFLVPFFDFGNRFRVLGEHLVDHLFQVITDRATRPARAGRVRIDFHQSRNVERAPVVKVQTETGSMRVSTPEATAFDLVRFAAAAGHASNVATVLSELSEKLGPAALEKLADSYVVPEVQRIGYLLEQLGEYDLAKPLAEWLGKRRYRPIPLVPGKALGKISADPKWRVLPNERVEVDL